MNEEQRLRIERNQSVFLPHLMRLATDALNSAFRIELDELHSFFANNYTCFVVDQNEELRKADHFQQIDFKLFAFEPGAKPLFFEMLFVHRNNNVNFHELVLQKVEVLYKNSEHSPCQYDLCTENGLQYSFWSCFYYCLKKSATKMIYLYERTENLFVNLSDGRRNVTQELECIRSSCHHRSSCLRTSYNSFNFKNENHKPLIRMNTFIYQAYYPIDDLDFYLQLIGLIALFLNVSLVQVTPGLLRVTARAALRTLKVQHRIRFDRLMKGTKLFVKVACLCLLGFLSFLIVKDFYQNLRYPIELHHYTIEPRSLPISIVLCVPVQTLIYNGTAEPSRSVEEAILRNNSFEMIEQLTDDGLPKVLQTPIYVSYESIEKRLDYEVSKSVLFANGTYKLDYQPTVLLRRCFRIDFNHNETAYEHYLLLAEIILRIRNNSRVKIYPTQRGENFLSGNTFEFKAKSGVYMVTTRRSVNALGSNCTNYSERSDLECGCQRHCIERCIAANFLANHSSITTTVVIEKEELAKMRRGDFGRLYFNMTPDRQIENDCREKFSQVDCEEQTFKDRHRYGHREPGEYKINLYNYFVYSLQQSDSYEKLALKFLNILSIIYGFSIKKFLNFILSFREFRSTYKRLCERFILLVTLALFVYNVFVIVYEVINEQLVVSATFKQIDQLQLPDIVFCVNILDIMPDYQQEIEHHKVTGRLLDELTSNYTLHTFLAKLVYLNNENGFTEFKAEEHEKALFEFQTYLFLNLKCWQISTKITYSQIDLYSLDDPYLIKFYLNRTSLPKFFYFAEKSPDSKVFTRIVKLLSSERVNRKSKCDHSKQTTVEKFGFLQHPLAWFYERFYGMTEIQSRTDYLDKLKNDFRRQHHLTTRSVVLEPEHFDYEIQEPLFQVQRQIDEAAMPKAFSKLRSFECSFIDEPIEDDQSNANELADFEIFSNFFIFSTYLFSNCNFIKFVQDLLNAASFCLGLCILDLHVCLRKSTEFVLVLYAHLQSCRSYFAANLTTC